ncbi:MAG: hypothetical protein GY847_17295 [Proteobacteria bacterium]|nr:hypothetical protein [Pseudomonadota bacterium]
MTDNPISKVSPRVTLILSTILLVFLGTIFPLSTSQAKQQDIDSTNQSANESSETIADSQAMQSSDESELEDLKKALEEQKQTNEEQQNQYKNLEEQISELQSRMTSVEEENEALVDTLETAEMTKLKEEEYKLRFYGFTSVSFVKNFIDKDKLVNLWYRDTPSFSAWHLNLYLDHQLDESFRMLGEVYFTMLPLGKEEIDGLEIVRTDTTVLNPSSAHEFRHGSISIARLWIEYKPMDYFGLRIGRFLTPYGVWNVDHGSTVIISVRIPGTMIFNFLPEAQTGLYAFGRVFPTDKLLLNYGLTFTNGRGPMDEIYDLDNNKGVGARLRLAWEGKFRLALGSYLYTGEYTDLNRRIASINPIGFEKEIKESYREWVGAFDLLFEYAGLRIQSEFLYKSMIYNNQKRSLNEFDPTRLSTMPDHYSTGVYTLIAYRLPIQRIELMPYFMYDYIEFSNFMRDVAPSIFTGGLNWRVTPFIVWKAEYYYVFSRGGATDFQGISTQLAVSF